MTEPGPAKTIVVGVSGASGMPYAARLLAELFDAGCRLHVIATSDALTVIGEEMGLSFESPGAFDPAAFCGRADMAGSQRVAVHDAVDFTAPPASGSFRVDGMVVAPCSMRTLGALASGVADNLLLRAADCQLKEGRRLVLVPRETPLSLIHLENMTRLARAGAVILPAMPAYYYRPRSLEDHERFLATKVCDQLGVAIEAPVRWSGKADE